jgi:predicted secreted protein
MEVKGRALVFKWGGADIPGVRQKGFSAAGERIDVTSDDDDGWRKLAENGAAQNNIDITLSGVRKDDNLLRDWMNEDRIKAAEFIYPDGSRLTGTFHLVSYNETGAYNDAVTFEATLQNSGIVSYDPGS